MCICVYGQLGKEAGRERKGERFIGGAFLNKRMVSRQDINECSLSVLDNRINFSSPLFLVFF